MWGTLGLQEKQALVTTQDQLTLAINRLREQEAEAAVHKVSCQAKECCRHFPAAWPSRL